MALRYVLCVRCKTEKRNKMELMLYSNDDLRRLYQECTDNLIRLRDGGVSRAEIVAGIRWRVFWERFGYSFLAVVSVVAAIAAIIAAFEDWK